MCLDPKIPKDNSAALARQREEERAALVAQNQQIVDSSLSGFNGDFYRGLTDAFTNYYAPQLDTQYADADRSLRLGLADQGILASSAANRQHSNLMERYLDARADIGNRAQDAVQKTQTQVEGTRANLYDLARSGAAPTAVASSARLQQGSIPDQLTRSPLGDVFGTAAKAAAAGISAERAGYRGWGTGWFDTPAPASRVVGGAR